MTPHHPTESSPQRATGTLDAAFAEFRPALLPLAAFSFAINLLVLAVPLFMLQVFDRVMTSQSFDTLAVLTVGTLGALAVMAFLDLVRSRLLVRMGAWLDHRLGDDVFRAAVARGSDATPLRDLARLRGFLSGPDVLALLDAPWAPAFIALIFFIHPVLGLIALGGAVALLAMAWLNEVLTNRALTRASGAAAGALHTADESARLGEAVRGLGMISNMTRRWRGRRDMALDAQVMASDRAGAIMAATRWLRLALQVVIVAVAATLVIGQEASVGALVAVSIVLARALAPVEQAMSLWRNVTAARAALARLRATLADTGGTTIRTALPRPEGRLAVESISHRQPGAAAPLMEDASFEVEPGELVGITGASGAGKTTLLRMLVGVQRPDCGTVRLDGADLADWSDDDRGRHIGFLPQESQLLGGTVAENIARGSDAPAEAVINAARRAGAHDLILHLPSGYDTPASMLSSGAGQRVALARALFGDPVLLVLDEPYSNLDQDGVEALIAAVEDARSRGAAVVIAAHRPSILARADRVLTLEGGNLQAVARRRRAPLRLLSCETAESPEVAANGESVPVAIAG